MTIFNECEISSLKKRLAKSPEFLDFFKKKTAQSLKYHAQFEAFSELDAALHQIGTPSSEEILELAEQYINIESIKGLLDYELEQYRTFPLYYTPMSGFNTGAVTGWLLFENPHVIVVLTVIECVEFAHKMELGAVPQTLKFNSGDELFHILKSDQGLVCSKWEAPLITDEKPVKPGVKCKLLSADTYKTGDKVFTKGGTQALSYDGAYSTTVGLKIHCRKRRSSVIADYDKETQDFKQVIAADQRSTRFQLLASLMRIFECNDAFSLVESLLDHPDYFVRWQAAREMIALSPQQALPKIATLAETDRNPLVRKSAAKTAELLRAREAS